MKKRVLFVGYFYPDANMGGVRMRRLARLLPRCGWEPVVLTHTKDASSVDESAEGVRVEEVAAPDLTRAYRRIREWTKRQGSTKGTPAAKPMSLPIGFTSEINRWLMIPDKQIPWRRAAIRRGRKLLATGDFSVIFASHEPRTSLLVAAQLSKETGIPCVLEYRDLWTGNPYYHITQPTGLHRWIHRNLERRALQQATRVSAVSRGIAEYVTKVHGDILRNPIDLNYNFFDPEEYPLKHAESRRSSPFVVSYTGALYGTRKPHEFFEGMQSFIKSSGVTPAEFRFRWAGGASGINDLEAIIDQTGVRPHLDFLGQVPHRDALRQLTDSHAALLLQAPDDAIHIPGKLFEAMGARIPVVAIAHPCEVTEIVDRCRAGIVCSYSKESVASALTELHRLHASGRPWNFDEQAVEQFSAIQAVGKLGTLFAKALA